MLQPDEFDVLLDDVLRTVANPEIPRRLRVKVRTRVWVREMVAHPISVTQEQASPRPAVVYSPEVFLEKMEPKRDARSTMFAILLHAAAILLIFCTMALKMPFVTPGKTDVVTELTPPAPDLGKMGGGGGQKGLTAVTKGKMPKIADLQKPKLTMPDPTVNVQKDLKMTDSNMPNFGDPNSPLVGNSMGRGSGTGMGNGTGSGIGSGSGGGMGGGVRQVGGGVKGPVIIYQPEPEFSEEARKAKFMGVVTVSLIVGADGKPQNVHVTRGVGMGLDENAVAAVKQYRFKPATENGKAVAVYLNVEVNFEIF
jgi:protein TonB